MTIYSFSFIHSLLKFRMLMGFYWTAYVLIILFIARSYWSHEGLPVSWKYWLPTYYAAIISSFLLGYLMTSLYLKWSTWITVILISVLIWVLGALSICLAVSVYTSSHFGYFAEGLLALLVMSRASILLLLLVWIIPLIFVIPFIKDALKVN